MIRGKLQTSRDHRLPRQSILMHAKMIKVKEGQDGVVMNIDRSKMCIGTKSASDDQAVYGKAVCGVPTDVYAI